MKAARPALADYELLELLLTYVIPRVNTKPIAKALLHKFGSILDVLQQPNERLIEIKGVGQNTVTFIRLVHACLSRCMETGLEQQRSISGPEDIFAFVRMNLGSSPNESIYALYLNEARRIIYHGEVAAGTINRVPFYPREVLKPALVHNATGIIIIHNHPEGQPVPSENDLDLTRMLEEVAAPLGLKLIDHMIVTRKQAYSLKTGKLL